MSATSGARRRAFARELVQEFFAQLGPVCNAARAERTESSEPDLLPVAVPPEARRRFWGNVAKGGDTECWIWNGAMASTGYGRFVHDSRYLLAHRFAYEISVGPIPPGYCVLHSCDNRRCQNPAHLRVGTAAENVADTVTRRRHQHGENHRNAKLTAAAVRDIRSSRENNTTLAERYGVSRAAIAAARKGRTWSLLDCPPAAKPADDD